MPSPRIASNAGNTTPPPERHDNDELPFNIGWTATLSDSPSQLEAPEFSNLPEFRTLSEALEFAAAIEGYDTFAASRDDSGIRRRHGEEFFSGNGFSPLNTPSSVRSVSISPRRDPIASPPGSPPNRRRDFQQASTLLMCASVTLQLARLAAPHLAPANSLDSLNQINMLLLGAVSGVLLPLLTSDPTFNALRSPRLLSYVLLLALSKYIGRITNPPHNA